MNNIFTARAMVFCVSLSGVLLSGCASGYGSLASNQQNEAIKATVRYLKDHVPDIYSHINSAAHPGALVMVPAPLDASTNDDLPIMLYGPTALNALNENIDNSGDLHRNSANLTANDFSVCVFFYKESIPLEPSVHSCHELWHTVLKERRLIGNQAAVNASLRNQVSATRSSVNTVVDQNSVLQGEVEDALSEIRQHRAHIDGRLDEINQELEW